MPRCCVNGPRALALTGRVADAALAAGRDPAAVRRVYNVNGSISDGPSAGPFAGPVAQWVDERTVLVHEQGIDAFVLWTDGEPLAQLHRWAEEVAPAVRAAVDAARG